MAVCVERGSARGVWGTHSHTQLRQRNKRRVGSGPSLAPRCSGAPVLPHTMSWSAARSTTEFTPKRPPSRSVSEQGSPTLDESDIQTITNGAFQFVLRPPEVPSLADGSEIPYLPVHSAMPSPRARALSARATERTIYHRGGPSKPVPWSGGLKPAPEACDVATRPAWGSAPRSEWGGSSVRVVPFENFFL